MKRFTSIRHAFGSVFHADRYRSTRLAPGRAVRLLILLAVTLWAPFVLISAT